VLRTVGFVVTDDGSGPERCGYDTTECFHARRCRAPTGAVDFYRVKASAALETNSDGGGGGFNILRAPPTRVTTRGESSHLEPPRVRFSGSKMPFTNQTNILDYSV
jgi:hypothetical protein